MKTRVIVTTILSFVLLLAVVAAGLNIVFTVTLVDTQFSLISETGRREAEELKETLGAFRGRSTTFLKLSSIEEKVKEYPCLRLDSVRKKYPSTVEVKISERKQTFAVSTEEGYAILDDEGKYLYTGENVNRAGGENIELVGFSGWTFERDQVAKGTLSEELFTVLGVFTEALGELRASVLSVSVREIGIETLFVLQMREGIVIELEDPTVLPAEKAHAALYHERGGYFAREDEDLVRGTITVVSSEGEIFVDYNKDR